MGTENEKMKRIILFSERIHRLIGRDINAYLQSDVINAKRAMGKQRKEKLMVQAGKFSQMRTLTVGPGE